MNFEAPIFTFWNVVFTAIGAAVFWGKWGRTRLRAFILSDIIGYCFRNRGDKDKLVGVVEFLTFVILGCIVGVGVAQPESPLQALTAGFGWTGFFTGHR